MCGRFSLKTPPAELAAHFGLAAVPSGDPRYNIAPTQVAGIVREDARGGRELVTARWGLVPAGSPNPGVGPSLINARSETVAVKAPFRLPFEHARCLVPADGFFEWKRGSGRPQPYYITTPDGRPFAFAGLWDQWQAHDGTELVSFTVLTTTPNDVVARLHDRMPVILPPTAYAEWLATDTDPSALARFFGPFPSSEIIAYPVSRRVNKADNEGPECIRRVEEPLELDLR